LLRRWREAWRAYRLAHWEADLAAWLAGLRGLLDDCREALPPTGGPAGADVFLARIDGHLEHLRWTEGGAVRAAQGRSPAISARLRAATERAVHLRNQTQQFLISRLAAADAELEGRARAFLQRREMDDALLTARRTLRALSDDLAALNATLLTPDPENPSSI
jgi:hypothetical protein